MSHILVSYFSASGVTKKVATKLAEMVEGDLFEIEPTQRYTSDDLNWRNKQSRSSLEMNDPTSRPEIKNRVNQMDDYEKIFIGYPIWWGLAPTIIHTFIEAYDLSDKKIYLFATSGGSGIDYSYESLCKAYPKLKIVDAKRLSSHFSDHSIRKWINQ